MPAIAATTASRLGKQPHYAGPGAQIIYIGDRDGDKHYGVRLRSQADGVNIFSESRSGYNEYEIEVRSWAGANVLETKDLLYTVTNINGEPPYYCVAFKKGGDIEVTKFLDDSRNPAKAPMDEKDLALFEEVVSRSDLLPELQKRFSDDLPRIREIVRTQSAPKEPQ